MRSTLSISMLRCSLVAKSGWVLVGCGLLSSTLHADTLRVPKDFGTIQAAIDAAQADDEILVSKGEYAPFTIFEKADLSLRGKGKVVIRSAPFDEGVAPLVLISSSQRISLSRLRLEAAPGDGVLVANSSEIELSRLRIDDVVDNSIQLLQCTDVLIFKLRAENSGDDMLRTDSCEEITIDKCVLIGSGNDAVAFSVSNDLGLTNNSTVSRTRILFAGDDGIDANGDNNFFDRVVVRDAEEDAFEIDSDTAGANNTFFKCRAIRPEDTGFEINGSQNTLDRCKAVKCGDDGIALRGTGGHEVLKAKIVKPVSDGVFIAEGSAANTLTDCKISSPGHDGIDVESTGNMVTGNKVGKAGENGLEVEATSNSFVENRFKGSDDLDISDETGGAGNTYIDNVFKTSNLP